MKVVLLAHTPDPERLVATAGRTCYSAKSPSEIYAELTEEEIVKQLSIIHGSCYEHAVFTFALEGISRACSQQIERHRLASYSQQSQRYVSMSKADVVMPESILDDEQGAQREYLWYKAVDTSVAMYDELVAAGVPKEDARMLLPIGMQTNVIVTMNARELMHFFGLRCCERAQKEVRDVAEAMKRECIRVAPNLFMKAGPYCMQTGHCTEHRSCGRCPQ